MPEISLKQNNSFSRKPMPIILPQILMVQRDESFSPNAVEKDLAILQAVGEKLRDRGASVSYVKEELLQDNWATAWVSSSRWPVRRNHWLSCNKHRLRA